MAEFARVGDGVEEILEGDAGAPLAIRGGTVEAPEGHEEEEKAPPLPRQILIEKMNFI